MMYIMSDAENESVNVTVKDEDITSDDPAPVDEPSESYDRVLDLMAQLAQRSLSISRGEKSTSLFGQDGLEA